MKHIFFIDTEVSETDNKAYDFGAVNENDDKLHTGTAHEFHSFIAGAEYLCGHNIIKHDVKYIETPERARFIDTLYLSPLMFPNKPYHKLLKDDKLQSDELNNPLNDAVKAKELFYDEVNAFSGFFDYMDFSAIRAFGNTMTSLCSKMLSQRQWGTSLCLPYFLQAEASR